MALLLSGCGLNPKPSEQLTAPLQVKIPSEPCEAILKRVPLPALKVDDDADGAIQKEDNAIITAGDRIDAGRNCMAGVRKRYEGK